jgi:hypothetical protein
MWSVVVAVFGGFSLPLGVIRVSSHNPRNPALLALVSAAAAAALMVKADRDARRQDWFWAARAFRWFRLAPPPVIIALVAIGLETYQWQVGRPLWLDEEMIALNVRDRSIAGFAECAIRIAGDQPGRQQVMGAVLARSNLRVHVQRTARAWRPAGDGAGFGVRICRAPTYATRRAAVVVDCACAAVRRRSVRRLRRAAGSQ